MNINKHITDLLYYHDCVILPEFGGFVVNYREAQIDFQQQKLSPPSRIVAFNQSLTINDGLLINAIAQTEGITYEKAAVAIEQHVSKIRSELKSNSVLNIENIGKFTLTNDILEFHPDKSQNFLLDSFGLSDFHYPMLTTPKPQQVIEEARKEIVEKVINQPNRKPSWAIAIPALAASIALAVLFFNQTHIPKLNLNNTEMNTISIPSTKTTKPEKVVKNNIVETEIVSSPEVFEEPIEIVEVETVVEETIVRNVSAGNIHIIAGCFSVEENAIAMVNKYNALGYNAQIIESKDNLHRVSLKSYNVYSDAVNELNQLKEATDNQSLWILER